MKSINSRQTPEVKALFALRKTKEPVFAKICGAYGQAGREQVKFTAEGLRAHKLIEDVQKPRHYTRASTIFT